MAKAPATPAPTISPLSKRILNAFDKAAQRHGWEQDQGSWANAVKARQTYEKARDRMIARIADLEKT